MGTYADNWNAKHGSDSSSGPTLVILSGLWDSEAETSELMDYQLSDDVAEAIVEMRSSRASNASSILNESTDWEAGMDVDWSSRGITKLTIIPDTNVMISYLPLMDALANFLNSNPDVSASILIPGLVMAELDGINKGAQKRSLQAHAQNANRWAAAQLQRRAAVRGQRDSATAVPGGSWRRHYYETGKANPDGYILDCAFYERERAEYGKWIVLTLDENCGAQCLANDLPVVKPGPSWNLRHLAEEIFHDFPDFSYRHQSLLLDQGTNRGRPQQPPSHSQRSSSNSAPPQAPIKKKPSPSASSRTKHPKTVAVTVGMEVDDEYSHILPRAETILPERTDPRNDLQDQLIAYLRTALPLLVEQSIKHYTQDTLSSSTSNKLALKPLENSSSASIHSIHVPKPPSPATLLLSRSRSPLSAVCQSQPLPSLSSNEWKSWSPHQCIQFLIAYPVLPPPSSPGPSFANGNASASSIIAYPAKTKSYLESLASFVRGDRRGREFGRGDWERVCEGLGVLCPSIKDDFASAAVQVLEAPVV